MKQKQVVREQTRSYTSKLTFRTGGRNGTPQLEGMIVPWAGEPLGHGITENYSKAAFDADISALEEGTGAIPLQADHSFHGGLPLGATTALKKKDDGLYATFELPTSQADDVKALVNAGVLRGFSIGMTDIEYESSKRKANCRTTMWSPLP